tara:strand:+ start:3595 stop:5439 length:1845 start_codon:yes stop_codon:yes gene_type:complete
MTGSRGKIENFGGQIPKVSARLLPPTNARVARNVKLQSGELRGIRIPEYIKALTAGTLKVLRIPDALGTDGYTYVEMDALTTDVHRGPLLNDTYERFYEFGDGTPKYNTLARIRTGDPWYILGIPVPVGNGTVTPSGGVGAADTRYYVYTFVSAYGEEGPPSSPITAAGLVDDTWTLTVLDTTVPDAASRNIDTVRIYRTVSGYSVTEFFFVADIALATGTYADTSADIDVSRNAILESEQWFAPSATMEGVVAMPNGFFVGWEGRNVYFSETYRPHAWPPPYDLGTEFDILGAGVFGQSVGIVTTGNPYIGAGAAPEAVTLTKSSTVEPGLSANGIVTMTYGVLYPSQNGLVLLGPDGPSITTRQMITKPEWLRDYSPETIIGAKYQEAYIGFYGEDDGFVIDPLDPRTAFTELDRFLGISNIQTDPFTGTVFLIINDVLYEWDYVDQLTEQYQWRSKDFVFNTPCNIGAVHIEAAGTGEGAAEEATGLLAAQSWNDARFAAGPLDHIGFSTLGSATPTYTLASPNDVYRTQNKQPLGGSPLIDTAQLEIDSDIVRLVVYADGTSIFDELWLGQQCIRLPSGFKARTWAFEVHSTRTLYGITFAETCRGLQDV